MPHVPVVGLHTAPGPQQAEQPHGVSVAPHKGTHAVPTQISLHPHGGTHVGGTHVIATQRSPPTHGPSHWPPHPSEAPHDAPAHEGVQQPLLVQMSAPVQHDPRHGVALFAQQ